MMALAKLKVAAVMLGTMAASGLLIAQTDHPTTVGSAQSSPASQPGRSAVWWRQQAVRYAGNIADAEARGKAHSELVYVLGHAGDLDAARAAVASISNPQLRIYAHCFLAKQYQKKGDDIACHAEVEQAGKESLAWDSNFGHAHVIQTYMELAKPEEAIALAAGIALEFHRNVAFRDIAAKLAEQGKLDMAEEIVRRRLPATWVESGWSVMANACADALRIDEAEKFAARLTDKKLQDQACFHLVDALVKADRADEAGPFADRIAEERLQAAARATITASSAKKQSVAVLESSIEKAATREEKLALYDMLFAKLVEAENIAAADAVIDAMVKTIEAFPRAMQVSKFGKFGDAVAMAGAQSNYLATAAILAKQGDHEGSVLRLARARKAVTELPEPSGLAKMMLANKLVNAEIAIGDFSGAQASLQQLEKGFPQSALAGQVAAGLIKSGDVKSGLAVAEMITTPLGKGLAMAPVVCELLRVGETKAARTLLEKLGDGSDDIHAFRAVGGTMIELGRATELEQWLGDTSSNVARSYMCSGAAEELAAKE